MARRGEGAAAQRKGSDTSPPAGCCRAAPEVRGQPVSAEQVRRSGCAGAAREAHEQPVQRVALPGDAVGRQATQDEETSMVKLRTKSLTIKFTPEEWAIIARVA